ncbi:hypothetical protein IAT38_002861 [Cryptococcus sp. DSM 104549]
MSYIARSTLRSRMGTSAGPSTLRATTTASATATARLATMSRHMSSSKPVAPPNTASHDDLVLYEAFGNVRQYKLNRSNKLNSLNVEMINSLAKTIKAWREVEGAKVIVGTGDSRAFCAGGDVKQLAIDLLEGSEAGKTSGSEFFKNEFQLNWLLSRLGKPYVAVIDGVTMGGGAGLSLPAQIRIATPKTIFAMPETKIGYAPDVGASYYLAQLDGHVGSWLAVTGQELYGRAVYELGIATHYVNPETIPQIIEQLAAHDTPSISTFASVVSSFTAAAPITSELSSKTAPDGRSPITGEIRQFLDKTFNKKSVQEIYAALEKAETEEGLSEGVKSWAKEQKAHMDARSPTGMAVALQSLIKAKKSKRLDRTLLNDYAMANAFVGPNRATNEFLTGVSAVLIDRSKTTPSWSPASLSDKSLTPEAITKTFFTPSSSTPELEFHPESQSKLDSTRDSSWGQFRKYGLPSEKDVRAAVDGDAPGSGAFALKEAELIEQLGGSEVRGQRRREVEGRVRDIVKAHCRTKADGYLQWAT